MKLFTTSKMGLGINTNPSGQCPRKKQGDLAVALKTLSNAQCPDKILGPEALWCPITGFSWLPGAMHAAHIYPSAVGAQVMHILFQTDEDQIFSPLNAFVMCENAERRINKK